VISSNGTGSFLRFEKTIGLDLSGDKTKSLCLRKLDTEFKDEMRELLASLIEEFDAKYNIVGILVNLCVDVEKAAKFLR